MPGCLEAPGKVRPRFPAQKEQAGQGGESSSSVAFGRRASHALCQGMEGHDQPGLFLQPCPQAGGRARQAQGHSPAGLAHALGAAHGHLGSDQPLAVALLLLLSGTGNLSSDTARAGAGTGAGAGGGAGTGQEKEQEQGQELEQEEE